MVEISKMKYRGCCQNCLSTMSEKQIYRIEIELDSKIEFCKDCMTMFMKEMNEKYLETAGD